MFMDIRAIPAIGEARIDDAHRGLARDINALYEQWRVGTPLNELVDGFTLFLRSLGRHFAEEADIAAAAGCPGVVEHVERHREILADLTALVTSLEQAEDGDPCIDAFSFIARVLHEHEILDDQEFWPTFQALDQTTTQSCEGPLVAWSAAMETGHAELDRQHRTLVSMINVLDARLIAGAPRCEIIGLLDRMVAHTTLHFRWEERQMAVLSAPDARVHCLLHRALLADLCQVVEGVRAGETAALPDMLRSFLKYWFVDHVRHVDGDLACALGRAGRSGLSTDPVSPKFQPPSAPEKSTGSFPRQAAFAG